MCRGTTRQGHLLPITFSAELMTRCSLPLSLAAAAARPTPNGILRFALKESHRPQTPYLNANYFYPGGERLFILITNSQSAKQLYRALESLLLGQMSTPGFKTITCNVVGKVKAEISAHNKIPFSLI